MIIHSAEDENRLKADTIMETSEQTLMAKIQDVVLALKNETDPERLAAYGEAITNWLSSIEKLRRLRNHGSD